MIDTKRTRSRHSMAQRRSTTKRTKSSPRCSSRALLASCVFGYLVWIQTKLMIRSSELTIDNTNNSNNNNGGGDELGTTINNVLKSFRQGISYARNEETKDNSLDDDINPEQLARELVKILSSGDGIKDDDRHGFEITLNGNDDDDPSCRCDVVSADCLHTIACSRKSSSSSHGNNKSHIYREHALVWLGVQLRRAIKATARAEGDVHNFENIPLGKHLQYSTMDAWINWRQSNQLPKVYFRWGETEIFVKESWYPACMEANGIKPKHTGLSCFYTHPTEPEEDFNGNLLEEAAHDWYNRTMARNPKVVPGQNRTTVRNILEAFLVYHQQPQDNPHQLSPMGSLLLFAHTCRIMFNRRSFLDEIYRDKHTSVATPNPNATKATKETAGATAEPFLVAVHIRRGDSCGRFIKDPRGYEVEATPLHSRQQTGDERKCYQTRVYMETVQRIRELVPASRPLHVYLATDDVGDVLDEIFSDDPYRARKLAKHSKGEPKPPPRHVYGVDEWHFLNYSRHHFDYKGIHDAIEFDDHGMDHMPILGETAISDLWLLSHGIHTFVGHMGSRFGKVSWLLATARRNDFVPFFSVDGHSFCCEIDEACGRIKPFVTVDNCLTFGHEFRAMTHENYWKDGSLARTKYYLQAHDGVLPPGVTKDFFQTAKDPEKVPDENTKSNEDGVIAIDMGNNDDDNDDESEEGSDEDEDEEGSDEGKSEGKSGKGDDNKGKREEG